MWENINDKKRKIRLGFDETYSKTSNDDVVQRTSVLREKELVNLSKNASTVAQLVEAVRDFSKQKLMREEATGAIDLDVTGTSHRILHAKLLMRMASYGVICDVIVWTPHYLTRCDHVVENEDAT